MPLSCSPAAEQHHKAAAVFGLSELHIITTYTAVVVAVFLVALVGVMPPLAIIAFPVATFVAKWLWKKGKEEGRKEERR